MLNEQIFFQLNNLAGRNPIFDDFIIFSARYLIVILFVFCAFFLFRISKKATATFILAVAFAFLADQLFHRFLPVERPFIGREVNLLLPHVKSFSFPSGHVLLAASSAFSLFFYQKKTGLLAILVVVLIGFSRVVGGIHWPLDILAGLLFGFLIALSAKKILDNWV